MIFRAERPADIPKIFKLNLEAFNSDDEAYLVDRLRNKGVPMISWVAEEKKEIIGHILFTPVFLIDQDTNISIAGLGPMAVRPSWQKKGVGSKLIEEGLEQCINAGFHAVVVLGLHDYYPRFGFVPSANYGIHSMYDVPPELFMIKELKKGSLKKIKGSICYHELFTDMT